VAKTNLAKATQENEMANAQLGQFNLLKQKLFSLYQMQGFKHMVRSNPNMSQFLGIVQQDFIKDGNEENMLSAQVTRRSVNVMEFNRMIEKLKY